MVHWGAGSDSPTPGACPRSVIKPVNRLAVVVVRSGEILLDFSLTVWLLLWGEAEGVDMGPGWPFFLPQTCWKPRLMGHQLPSLCTS